MFLSSCARSIKVVPHAAANAKLTLMDITSLNAELRRGEKKMSKTCGQGFHSPL